MKIYTKTGDDGTTGLFGGGRVEKDSLRVEAYGNVDELNCMLGSARTVGVPGFNEAVATGIDSLLLQIQNDLFVLGSDLATPRDQDKGASYLPRIESAQIEALEGAIDDYDGRLEPLKNFILPGGSGLGSTLHLSRAMCRRAERSTVAASHKEEIGELPVQYLNRLSDLLFVLARYANHVAQKTETEWAPRKP